LHELSAPVHDPWLLTQHGIRALPGAVNWAPAFVQWLLPWLRGWSFENLRAAEQAFLALAPWHDDALTAMVCAVTTGGQPAWLRLGAQEPLARRPLFFARLLGAEAFRLAPPRDAARLFTALRHLTRAGSAERDLGFAFTGLRLAAEPAHLAESLRLGRAYGWDPAPQRPADRVPCRAIGRLVRRLSSYAGGWKDRSERLWKLGCRLPGSSEILRGVARWRLSDEERRAIVYFLEDFDAEDAANARRRVRRWKTLQPRWREVLAAARLTPPTHRTKAWTLLGRLSSRSAHRLPSPRCSTTSSLSSDASAVHHFRPTRRLSGSPSSFSSTTRPAACCSIPQAKGVERDRKAMRLRQSRLPHRRRNGLALARAGALRCRRAAHPRKAISRCDERTRQLAQSGARPGLEHIRRAPERHVRSRENAARRRDCAARRSRARRCTRTAPRSRDGSRLLEPHRLAHYRAALASAWTRVQIEVLRGLIERALWLGFPTRERRRRAPPHPRVRAHHHQKTAPRCAASSARAIATCAPRTRATATGSPRIRLAGSVWEAGDLAFARDFAAPPIAAHRRRHL
jgi:hypothetical protein